MRLTFRCGRERVQTASKLIARSPGLPAGVLFLKDHKSLSRPIGWKVGQISLKIGKRDQRATPRLSCGKIAPLQCFINRCARHARVLDRLGQCAVCFSHDVKPCPTAALSADAAGYAVNGLGKGGDYLNSNRREFLPTIVRGSHRRHILQGAVYVIGRPILTHRLC